MINKRRITDEFMELVRFPSTSGNERLLADCLIGRLRALGMEVLEDDVGEKLGWSAGNVIARRKATDGGKQTLLLCAHMDHVAPGENIAPVVSEGIIHAKGPTVLGADDKAGIAPIMEALRVIQEQGRPHGELIILFTVGEETGLQGVRNIDPALINADLGYVFDTGGSAGEIVIQAPAHDKITACIRGKAAHAGVAPEAGVNAIQAAGAAIALMKSGRIDEETTANIGVIEGGKAANIVPDQVMIQCEARSLDLAKLAAQTEHMRTIFEQKAAEWKARAEVTVEREYMGFKLAESSPVVDVARRAAAKIGARSVLKSTGGGSDANFLNTYGIPSVVLGVGMRNVHTTDECIYIDDLVRTAEYILAIIETAGEA